MLIPGAVRAMTKEEVLALARGELSLACATCGKVENGYWATRTGFVVMLPNDERWWTCSKRCADTLVKARAERQAESDRWLAYLLCGCLVWWAFSDSPTLAALIYGVYIYILANTRP